MLPFIIGTGVINFLAWFGPEPLRDMANGILRTIMFMVLIVLVIIYLLINSMITSASCRMGDQASCYANSYAIETQYIPSSSDQALNNPPEDEITDRIMKRIGIVRHEWYKGQVVKTLMICVYPTYPVYDEEEHCLPREVVGTGITLPFPSDDSTDPASVAHRAMINLRISEEWGHVTW